MHLPREEVRNASTISSRVSQQTLGVAIHLCRQRGSVKLLAAHLLRTLKCTAKLAVKVCLAAWARMHLRTWTLSLPGNAPHKPRFVPPCPRIDANYVTSPRLECNTTRVRRVRSVTERSSVLKMRLRRDRKTPLCSVCLLRHAFPLRTRRDEEL